MFSKTTMKKLLLLLLILSINSYSQTTFEKGYFIDNNNNKTECLIRNVDWANNPTKVEYKISNTDKTKSFNITNVKEFEIYNYHRFLRKTVQIDRSNQELNSLTRYRNPKFEEEKLFLKELVRGKANLYFYADGDIKKYFYNVNASKIKQLIHKKYIKEEYKIGVNNQFRQQLLNNLNCKKISRNRYSNIEYNFNELISIFEDYNNCNNSSYVKKEKEKNKSFFNLNIRPRFNSSNFEVSSDFESQNINFGNTSSFGLGIEAEFILPFNNNKWSILFEPTYYSINSEGNNNSRIDLTNNIVTGEIDYTSIELALGLRHYFFINKKAKIFFDASYVLAFNLNEPVLSITQKTLFLDGTEFSNFTITQPLNNGSNIGIGIGYKYDKYSLELKYLANRNHLSQDPNRNSKLNSFSVIFGYTLF